MGMEHFPAQPGMASPAFIDAMDSHLFAKTKWHTDVMEATRKGRKPPPRSDYDSLGELKNKPKKRRSDADF